MMEHKPFQKRERLPRVNIADIPTAGFFRITCSPWVTFQNVYNSPTKFYGIIENEKMMVYDKMERKYKEANIPESQVEKLFNINIEFPPGAIPELKVYHEGKNGIMPVRDAQLVLKKGAFNDLITMCTTADIAKGKRFEDVVGRVIEYKTHPATFKKGSEIINYKKIKFEEAPKEVVALYTTMSRNNNTEYVNPPEKDEENLWS